SVGCQTILRFFEKVKTNSVAGGTIFVAPWTNLSEVVTTSDTDYAIAKPWLDSPIDFSKAKVHSKKFVAIFSDNDPYVPISESKTFEQKLGAKIIIEKNKDHYDIDSGIKELPIALNELLNM
ncbi:MAG: alpha/beta hydrolase, partial [archaeon]|nr:alpha/beta hydrolase [archaeon]